MTELLALVDTIGGTIVVETIQKRTMPDYSTYIGRGKLDEIKEVMKMHDAKILIIGNSMKAKQIYTVNELMLDIGGTCWDRVDLILKIFEQHAISTESKLQIELAAIKHM